SNRSPATETNTLSLHDALPILHAARESIRVGDGRFRDGVPQHRGEEFHVAASGHRPVRTLDSSDGCQWSVRLKTLPAAGSSLLRSEEHTSELQSLANIVCRLLL